MPNPSPHAAQDPMVGLTVCQPYAHLIAVGEKPIENRTWPTNYRGLVAIHAGKSRDWLDDGDETLYPRMAFGAVVAVARLSDCRRVEQLPDHLQKNEHANGPWCFVFSDVKALTEPIPYRGAQGFWSVAEDLRAQIESKVPR